MIALNKSLDPKDLNDPDLQERLVIVDQHFTKDAAQHVYRRWEYALSLLAVDVWGKRPLYCLDIGGAGSPLWRMLPTDQVFDVDPLVTSTLEEYVTGCGRPGDAVFCLSVLEHIAPEATDSFLYHLSCAVAPGGLLVMSMDTCGDDGPTCDDPHHYNWMRQQIFTDEGVERVRHVLHQFDFKTIGGQDPGRTHPYIHDYSFSSLVMEKRTR